MQIANVRLGHACNSSSSHSLLLLPGREPGPAAKADRGTRPGEYGWDWFQLRSVNDKAGYFAAQLYYSLERLLGGQAATTVIRELCGASVDKREWYDSTVDHQSQWGWPKMWGGEGVDIDFAKAVWSRMSRADVMVLGGNDNEDEWQPDDTGDMVDMLMNRRYERGPMVAKESGGGWWTVFSRATGAKVRFNPDPTAEDIARGKTPDLVDVKITGYCPFVNLPCHAYCYQASSPEGAHADMQYLMDLAHYLGKAKVFEVAIGGGEPTLHPEFENVLGMFASVHVSPNFTTRNYAWVTSNEQLLAETGSAVAFSVSSRDNAIAARSVVPNERAGKFSIQIVEGCVSNDELDGILDVWPRYLRVTVLGYKQQGHGADLQPSGMVGADMLRRVCEHGWNVAIDTAMARHLGPEAISEFSAAVAVDAREGAFSCYVDAIGKTMAPSSYSAPEAHVALKGPWEFDNQWKRLKVEQ